MTSQDSRPLDAVAIAEALLDIVPDRDERASQLTAEMLLTIIANNGVNASQVTPDELRSPRKTAFALRSLIFEQNFLEKRTDLLKDSSTTMAEFGEQLSCGKDFGGSSNLSLAKAALSNLVDPSTQRGSAKGDYLLRPFHQALLWYDARRSGDGYTVRQVRMRGTGITLARMLMDHPAGDSESTHEDATVHTIREALNKESPLATLANSLEKPIAFSLDEPERMNDTERKNWDRYNGNKLHDLAEHIRAHTRNIMSQSGASAPARLWHLRNVVAIDVALHVVRRAWSRTCLAEEERYLLVAMPGRERQQDPVRMSAERSYKDARDKIAWATISVLQEQLEAQGSLGDLSESDWRQVLPKRRWKHLRDMAITPYLNSDLDDMKILAQRFYENADYKRAGDSFRVLFESAGMMGGGTRYPYITFTPDVVASLVGALSSEMPMSSRDFLIRLKDEWAFVGSPEAARDTAVSDQLGSELARNMRHIERMLIATGLATGLSDRTVLVGERIRGETL